MVVHPVSHGVSRVPRYSGSGLSVFSFVYGTLTLYGWLSHAIRLDTSDRDVRPQPRRINPPVWPLPRSLATTYGISVDVSSSPYLDVSVQAVSYIHLFYSMHVDGGLLRRVPPFGNLRVKGYLLLPVAYRSLSRPSSASCAKASTVCPYHLLLDGSVLHIHSRPRRPRAIRCDLLMKRKYRLCHAMQLSRYAEGGPSRPDTARLAARRREILCQLGLAGTARRTRCKSHCLL